MTNINAAENTKHENKCNFLFLETFDGIFPSKWMSATGLLCLAEKKKTLVHMFTEYFRFIFYLEFFN